MDAAADRQQAGRRYDIVRLLGRGHGRVYEGHKPRINRRAAIKVLLPEFVGRADVVARFQ